MFNSFLKNNHTLISIALFIILFCIIICLKPGFLFNKDGSIKSFGLGYKKKTVIPIWLISIILGILVYYFISYLIIYPKLR